MKNVMMRVGAICMLFGATHAQIPTCKLTNDCKCVPSVTITITSRPDCVRSVTLVAPTAADNGCCENGFNVLCTQDIGCSYDLCAIVDMKEAGGCDTHNWSYDDGQGGTCTNKTGDGTACAGPDFPACGNNSGNDLYIYDAWSCITANLMWNASWTCVMNPNDCQ